MFEIYQRPKGRTRPLLGAAIGSIGFVGFLYLFYARYYKWRDCFDDLRPCHDPDGSGDVYTVAGIFWGCFSVPFLILAVSSLIILWRRRKSSSST